MILVYPECVRCTLCPTDAGFEPILIPQDN
jgi:hypothetical protein